MSKNHFDDLKEQIKQLNEQIDGKDFENELLQNEITDTLSPSVAVASQSTIIVEMLMELNQFAKKNGWTGKAKASKDRLIKLLDYNIQLVNITNTMATLKLLNKNLHSNYQILRVENNELRAMVKKMLDSFNGL